MPYTDGHGTCRHCGYIRAVFSMGSDLDGQPWGWCLLPLYTDPESETAQDSGGAEAVKGEWLILYVFDATAAADLFADHGSVELSMTQEELLRRFVLEVNSSKGGLLKFCRGCGTF